VSSAVDEIGPDERARYRRAGDALWRTAGSGVLVLPAGAKGPVAVVGAGRALWDVLATPLTLDEAATVLARRFGLPAEDVELAIRPVLADLGSLGAVDVLPP
jgi:hypothetical protein